VNILETVDKIRITIILLSSWVATLSDEGMQAWLVCFTFTLPLQSAFILNRSKETHADELVLSFISSP